MAKIALIGAGGVIFTQNFIKDILRDDVLRKNHIALMDIDQQRLDNAVAFTRKIGEQLDVTPNYSATTDLREALEGADYVITIFRVGTLDHQRVEQEIPRKYGVDQVVGDSMGPGGMFRGLRTLKALFEVLDAMEEVCPGAYLLNYVNPMSLNTIALNKRARTVKVYGLCHSVQHTSKQLSKYIDADRSKVSFLVAGVNHQAFFLKFEVDGNDAYPQLRQAMCDSSIYDQDRVRFELMKHFGYFPTESSGHGSEYVPYFRKRKDLRERFFSLPEGEERTYNMELGTSGASLLMCADLQEKNERRIAAIIDGSEQIDMSPSDEYGVQLIAALEKNELMSANLNVMNNGLIPSLPPECCVEVPCMVSASGIIPCQISDYPEQLAGLNRSMINFQMMGAEAALECSKRKVFQAIALDPLTAAVCSLDEIQAMTDELFEALATEISPSFG